MTVRLLPLLLLVLASTAVAQPFAGRDDEGREPPRERTGAAPPPRLDGHSLAESARRVKRETGGEILSAERVPFDGRDMNRIKVVDSTGRVRVITEDAQRPRRPRGRDD